MHNIINGGCRPSTRYCLVTKYCRGCCPESICVFRGTWPSNAANGRRRHGSNATRRRGHRCRGRRLARAFEEHVLRRRQVAEQLGARALVLGAPSNKRNERRPDSRAGAAPQRTRQRPTRPAPDAPVTNPTDTLLPADDVDGGLGAGGPPRWRCHYFRSAAPVEDRPPSSARAVAIRSRTHTADGSVRYRETSAASHPFSRTFFVDARPTAGGATLNAP